jgi:hypothetical protein
MVLLAFTRVNLATKRSLFKATITDGSLLLITFSHGVLVIGSFLSSHCCTLAIRLGGSLLFSPPSFVGEV